MTDLVFLYVPGDRPDRFDKAATSGADGIVLDLEDAVALDAKSTARQAVADWLARAMSPVPVWVRVNTGDLLPPDVAAVAPRAAGIWLPKCESISDLHRLDVLLAEVEAHSGRTPLPVSPLIETATGVFDVRAIATGPRVSCLQLGEVDLAADLGMTVRIGDEMAWARSMVVAASAAAGIRPPLAPASPVIDDPDAFRDETRRLTDLGFHGRACVHPRQIAPARAGMAPSESEVTHAEDVLTSLHVARGSAATDSRGRLIDEAVARQARRVLARRPGQERV